MLGWHIEAGIDKRVLRDLADIRLAVEPRAAALAAERRPDESIAILRESVARMRSFASDTLEFADADLRLHLDVATVSGNPSCLIGAAGRSSTTRLVPAQRADRGERA